MRTHAHARTRTRIQTHTLYRFHCNLQEVWVITTDTNKTHTYICAIVDWYIIEDKTIILTQWFCSRPTSRNVPYEVIRIWLQAQRFYYAKTCRFSTFLSMNSVNVLKDVLLKLKPKPNLKYVAVVTQGWFLDVSF